MFEPPCGLDQVFERNMSITPAEFARSLRDAFAEGVSGGPRAYRVNYGGALLEIGFEVGPLRRIASVALPTAIVSLCFREGEAAQRQALLQRMDRVMQRGGG